MANEVLTLAQLVTLARLHAQDTNTNAPSLTSAQYYDLADDAYLAYLDLTTEDVKEFRARDTGLALQTSGDWTKWTGALGVSPVPHVSRWLEVYRETAADAFTKASQMKIATVQQLRLMRTEDATVGTPEYCAFEKIATPLGAQAIAVATCTFSTASSGATQGRVTKASSFQSIEVGMAIEDSDGSDIPAASYVVQKDDDGTIYCGDILGARVTLGGASGDITVTPRVGQWRMLVWPPASGAFYFSTVARPIAFIPSTIGAAFVFDLEPSEVRNLAMIVAAMASPLHGYDEGYTESLWGRVPEKIRSAMRSRLEARRPS
jgi:hypothetical protein